MRKLPMFLASALATAGSWGWFGGAVAVPTAAVAQTATEAKTQAIVAATHAFLASLSADRWSKVRFPFARQQAATAAKFKGGDERPHDLRR